MFNQVLILASLFVTMQMAFAQDEIIPIPLNSPLEKTEAQIGIIGVSVEYSRPSVRGRKIFGELVPYNEVWRTGANINTRITFSGPVFISGQKLKEGAYSIFTIPGPNEWEVIFHTELNEYGNPDTILTENVLAKITVPSEQAGRTIETFSIQFEDLRNNGCNLVFSWDQVLVKVPIDVSTGDIMKSKLENSLAQTSDAYAYAASNYLVIEKDAKSALEAINKSISLKEKDMSFTEWLNTIDPKNWGAPWFYLLKSEIHAELGEFDKAIAAANRSLEICKRIDEPEHSIKQNNENIELWTK